MQRDSSQRRGTNILRYLPKKEHKDPSLSFHSIISLSCCCCPRIRKNVSVIISVVWFFKIPTCPCGDHPFKALPLQDPRVLASLVLPAQEHCSTRSHCLCSIFQERLLFLCGSFIPLSHVVSFFLQSFNILDYVVLSYCYDRNWKLL